MSKSEMMTKTEARAMTRRCREALRGFDAALKSDDIEALNDWALEASGAAAALAEYVEQHDTEGIIR